MNASSSLPGLDYAGGSLALPLWMAGALAAFFLVVCVVALNRDGPTRGMRFLVGGILVVAAALVSLAMVQGHVAGSAAARALLTAQINDLNARVLAQGSPLACLVGPSGEAVEASCEKSLFATPETTAAAMSFVATQVVLLGQAAEAGVTDTPAVLGLRRAVETDRYGLAAQVFSLRYGCAGDQCPAFAVLKDSARVRANLRSQKYDVVLRRYSAAWPVGQASVGVPSVGPLPAFLNGIVDPATMSATTNGSASIDYPSAASIPAISIMNAEPARPESKNDAAADHASATKPAAPVAQTKRTPAVPAPSLASSLPPPTQLLSGQQTGVAQ